jgi:hypothetical protein
MVSSEDKNLWEVSKSGAGKDGNYQLDRPCEKWRSVTKSQREEECPTYSKKEEGYLGWSHLA